METRIVFSDIDGTIMHSLEDLEEGAASRLTDGSYLLTPPSASGRQGVISTRTLRQVASLRRQGVLCVIITGARLSTLLMRLPFLPAADAFVCENGGRVFYPGSPHPSACPLSEDLGWRAQQVAAGPPQQDACAPGARQGALWEWFRSLEAQAWSLDASGYTTSFRVHARGGKSVEALQELIRSAPDCLACSWNLGAADFYPATSGKVRAAQYLMGRFRATPHSCTFMCDDDNDMELAAMVAKAFLPTVTSESVRQAVAQRPGQFVVARAKGTTATEEMLDAVAQHYGLQGEGGEEGQGRGQGEVEGQAAAGQEEEVTGEAAAAVPPAASEVLVPT
ncbi:hypothetical protein V8C86DRAFT_1807886 [Haematococcus lacustris]